MNRNGMETRVGQRTRFRFGYGIQTHTYSLCVIFFLSSLHFLRFFLFIFLSFASSFHWKKIYEEKWFVLLFDVGLLLVYLFRIFCLNVAMKVRRVCHMTIAFIHWRLPHSCIPFRLIANHMTDRMVGNVFLVFRICSTWEDDYTLRRMNQRNSNSNVYEMKTNETIEKK